LHSGHLRTVAQRDGATLQGSSTMQFGSAPPQFARQNGNENVQHMARELRVAGLAVAQREWHR